jgi:SHS2 domain-containing protein
VPFEFTDHDADIGIEATSPDYEGLFAEGARGLTVLLAGKARVREAERVRVEARGDDRTGVFVNWLREILSLYDTGGFLCAGIPEISAAETSVVAQVAGERRDPARHAARHEVKAVTWHAASVVRDGALWRARVVLDV